MRTSILLLGMGLVVSTAGDADAAFVQKTGAKAVKLNGASAQQWKASTPIAKLARAASDRGRVDLPDGTSKHEVTWFAAGFRLAPTELKQNLSGKRLQYFGHDVLFKSNRLTKDWDSSYERWAPRSETMAVKPIPASKALHALDKTRYSADEPVPTAAQQQKLQLMMGELLKLKPTRIYRAQWDNRDDTRFEGVIAVDSKRGHVYSIVSNIQ